MASSAVCSVIVFLLLTNAFFTRLFSTNTTFEQPPNGWRYRRLGRTKLGNGKLPKLEKSPKNAQSPSRPVHLRRMGTSYFSKETGRNRSILSIGRQISRTLALVSLGDSRGAPWFPITLIYPRVAPCATPITRSGYLTEVTGSALRPLTKAGWRRFRKRARCLFVVNFLADSSSQIAYICFLEPCVGWRTWTHTYSIVRKHRDYNSILSISSSFRLVL